MFFYLAHRLPKGAVIADSNPELINLYKQVAKNTEAVIRLLGKFKNTEADFYRIRAHKFGELEPEQAAARTIFLNRTCFNGLYRVNKKGEFNVPFGRYVNPSICNPDSLRAAAKALHNAEILCSDYRLIIKEFTKSGDLLFLDPPYLPISAYSDFKRYTKEQFYEEDHVELAKLAVDANERGAHVILTNSNHPLVHELYGKYELNIISTKRNINKDSSKRNGEDVIVKMPAINPPIELANGVPIQVRKYPPTKFMGSKEKLLEDIHRLTAPLNFETAVDLFAGSGIVGYLFKSQGRRVVSNDFLAMSQTIGSALIKNNQYTLTDSDIEALTKKSTPDDRFVYENFSDIFFSDEENNQIDYIRFNISKLSCPEKRALATSALIRACMKKQARGIFTYVGKRYDDGRRDLKLSIAEQFIDAAKLLNKAVFDNGKDNEAIRGDAMDFPLPILNEAPSLIYIDPPYFTPKSDADYVRRYHFVEGLACGWSGLQLQLTSKVKKFKSYPTPFSTQTGARSAFDSLFRKFQQHILVVSYSSNSLPAKDEMVSLLAKYKATVEVHELDYRYHFGNQRERVGNNRNKVKEYLFIAK